MGWFAYFIHEWPLTAIALVLFLALNLAREAGGWARRRVAGRQDDKPEESSDKSYVLSGVLGLLALLIAFTFSLSVDRYEARRLLVTAEANAIGTAVMRAQLLPAPHGEELTDLLRAYARTRMAYGLSGAAGKPKLAKAAADQRTVIQATALTALAPVATNPLGPFVGQSINAVLDVGVEREAAHAARVPASVLGALVLYALLTALILGYALTGARARHRPATIILFALLTLGIMLILDLDRPQGGSIRIDQTPMISLVSGFPRTATKPPESRKP